MVYSVSSACDQKKETIAEKVLSAQPPKGPLGTNQKASKQGHNESAVAM